MVNLQINKNIVEIEESKIRRHFDDKINKWAFSVVDIIAITTKTSDPRNYWKVLKNRLKNTQNKLVTECNQLKLKAADGKFYMTDVADISTMLGILEYVPNANLEPFLTFVDHVGASVPEEKKEEKTLDGFSKVPENTPEEAIKKTDEKISQIFVEGESELMIDGYDTGTEIVIEAMLGGVELSDLKISITNKKVLISGERKNSFPPPFHQGDTFVGESDDGEYLTKELYWGTFSRSIELLHSIQIDAAETHEENGRLIIKLPKI